MATSKIPETYLDLFQKRAFAELATIMPNGSPQVTPVWVDYDGQYVLVNSARGRQKDRNIERDRRVALDIMDPDNPYRHLQVRGRVVQITEEGAREHINKMNQKYRGNPNYPMRPGQVRVLYKIEPEHVTTYG